MSILKLDDDKRPDTWVEPAGLRPHYESVAGRTLSVIDLLWDILRRSGLGRGWSP
jgi:hypothetical protein